MLLIAARVVWLVEMGLFAKVESAFVLKARILVEGRSVFLFRQMLNIAVVVTMHVQRWSDVLMGYAKILAKMEKSLAVSAVWI